MAYRDEQSESYLPLQAWFLVLYLEHHLKDAPTWRDVLRGIRKGMHLDPNG